MAAHATTLFGNISPAIGEGTFKMGFGNASIATGDTITTGMSSIESFVALGATTADITSISISGGVVTLTMGATVNVQWIVIGQ